MSHNSQLSNSVHHSGHILIFTTSSEISLLDLAKTEVLNQKIKKRHNEELIIAQKKLKEVEEAAKVSASQKSSIKEYRKSLEAIEKSFEECSLKEDNENGTNFGGILLKQQDLQKSVAKNLQDLEASVTSEDQNDVKASPTPHAGSHGLEGHKTGQASRNTASHDNDVEFLKSRIDKLSKNLLKAIPLFFIPQTLSLVGAPKAWPMVMLDIGRQQLLLHDDIACE